MSRASAIHREAFSLKMWRRPVTRRGLTATTLLGLGVTGAAFGWSQMQDLDWHVISPSLTAQAETTLPAAEDRREFKQVLGDLEAELERLETASRDIDSRATELLGPPVDGQGRALKLPSEQDELVRYLHQCLNLEEKVDRSFGELVAGEGQVDLRERIPTARKHVQRLESAGAAGRLVRRQIRAWIGKDLQAVETLTVEWPAIRAAVQELIETTKQFEAGDVSFQQVAAHHQTVLQNAATRTHFTRSRLGLLCRQAVDAAVQMHRDREAQPAVALKSSSDVSLSAWNE